MKAIRTIIFALAALAAWHAAARAQDAPPVERDAEGRTARVRLERGGKIEVGNRTTGRIVVRAWDQDYVEAVATSERGTEYVRASSGRDAAGQRVFLKADYLTGGPPPDVFAQRQPADPLTTERSNPPQKSEPAPRPTPPTAHEGEKNDYRFAFDFPREVHLEVRVPRYAELDVISVNRSEVEVEGVETPVAVDGNRSTIRLRRVGAAQVRTASGAVEVEGAGGLVDVLTESGHVVVRGVRGDVRVLSLSGEVRIACVTGRVNVNNTRGAVRVAGAGGDVDATTVSSRISFEGALRREGRYHLKSMSGDVEMALAPEVPGFTALLSSYRGQIEDGFALKQVKTAADQRTSGGGRLLGRHGDGQAQVTLDSFDGRVKLARAAPGAIEECKQ